VAVAIPPRCVARACCEPARSRETARAERVRGAGASVAVVAQWGELERADGPAARAGRLRGGTRGR
jgi:hypothetical protein